MMNKYVLPALVIGTLLALNGAAAYVAYDQIQDKRNSQNAQPYAGEVLAPATAAVPATATATASAQSKRADESETAAIANASGEEPRVETAEETTTAAAGSTIPAAGPSSIETTVTIGNKKYKYVGDGVGGVAQGQGIAYYDNGAKRYEGEFYNGKPNFVGKLYEEDGTIRLTGTKTGEGNEIQYKDFYEDGSVYARVTYDEGSSTGQAVIYNPDRTLLYQGEVSVDSNRPQGDGIEYHPNGNTRYIGTFKDGQYNGSGTFITDDQREKYVGKFVNGELRGSGMFYQDGKLVYEGQHKDGVYNGQGKFYMNGMLAYEGAFVNGNMHGQGKMYDENGQLAYEGEFANNKVTGNGIDYTQNSGMNIRITITRPAVSGDEASSFNMPDGVEIPSMADLQP